MTWQVTWVVNGAKAGDVRRPEDNLTIAIMNQAVFRPWYSPLVNAPVGS